MRPGRSDISLKNWLPHGASGPLAKEARRLDSVIAWHMEVVSAAARRQN
eukprot:COSAG03_NODE_4161_length_1656_cov_3.524727_3_plen_49_part_00